MSTVPPVPDELRSRLHAGQCVLFAGNGVAIAAGYPSWQQLVRRLLDRLKDDVDGILPRLTAVFSSGGVSMVAEALLSSLGSSRLAGLVAEVYDDVKGETTPLHTLLGQLPFAGVLSWLWNPTLEAIFADRARGENWLDDPDAVVTAMTRESRFFLVRLCGDPHRPQSFLFTPGALRSALLKNELFLRFLSHLYSSYSFLFIGATVATIEDFLANLSIWDHRPGTHYALVENAPNLDVAAETMRARYGLRLLPYEATPGHSEVIDFVRRLGAEPEPTLRGAALGRAGGDRPLKPAALTRVVLDNVGLFEHLELELNAGWNVLLGNNGCGKSTVLRAVALGLCGDHPRATEAAGDLLRAGADHGSVELEIGGGRFLTELDRNGQAVRAHSAALTPVQAGRSVVLGFPPLRGASRQSPGGPTRGGSSTPEVADLLPLLGGRIDYRIDDAEQWIVNTVLRAEPGPGVDPETAAGYGRLRDTFFRLLGQLTPGVEFAFSRIDRATWQVLVSTPDGEIPIHTLSQGTTSILGWVGTLLQRMFEIHGSAATPEREPALVLVDEIDAHMHPEWQQGLVALFKESFPQVQVIATTHSPLVVGDLDPSEVHHLRRDPATDLVRVERMDTSFQGWRADQILTGPAFDLHTTLSRTGREWIEEYAELYGKSGRTAAEEQRLDQLRGRLRARIPGHPETAAGREALELVEEYLRDRLRQQPAERRRRIASEARHILAEIEQLR